MLWPEVQFVAFGYQRLIESSCKWAWIHSWRVRVPWWLVSTVMVIKVMTEPVDVGWSKAAEDASLWSFISIFRRVCSWCSSWTFLFVISITQFELMIRESGVCCSIVIIAKVDCVSNAARVLYTTYQISWFHQLTNNSCSADKESGYDRDTYFIQRVKYTAGRFCTIRSFKCSFSIPYSMIQLKLTFQSNR